MSLIAKRQVLPGVLAPIALIEQPARMRGQASGDSMHGDLIFENGVVAGMDPPSSPARGFVLPRLTEPHVHLDKCHTIDRLGAVGGDLAAAIARQWTDKANWTAADIRERAGRGLSELQTAGCGAVRTHVDWGRAADACITPVAWPVLRELAEDAQDMTIQLASLTSIAQLADTQTGLRIAREISRDNGVLGSFVLGHPERHAGLRSAFALADRFGLSLDFHVDEGLDPTLDGIELIADIALETNHQGPVLLGHACALMNLPSAPLLRVADKLAKAGISVAALPTTNLYLQSRGAGTPDRRGLTRIHELRAAGVNVVIGTDNVRDAFCPLGRHDPCHTLELAIFAAHLDPPLGAHLPMITTAARSALGLEPIMVDGARAQDLLIFDVASVSELLAGAPPPHLLSEHLPKEPA